MRAVLPYRKGLIVTGVVNVNMRVECVLPRTTPGTSMAITKVYFLQELKREKLFIRAAFLYSVIKRENSTVFRHRLRYFENHLIILPFKSNKCFGVDDKHAYNIQLIRIVLYILLIELFYQCKAHFSTVNLFPKRLHCIYFSNIIWTCLSLIKAKSIGFQQCVFF